MKLVDSHCHLQDSRLKDLLYQIIEKSRRNGIFFIFCCATTLDDIDSVLKLRDTYKEIVPFLGIHPFFINNLPDDWKERLENIIKNESCGIGETGLDKTSESFEKQKEVFEFHLELAKKYKRPVIVHCRKAWDEMEKFLENKKEIHIMFHSFSGPIGRISSFLRENIWFSFSGSLTWKSNKKTPVRLSMIPQDKLLFETDSPDIVPVDDNNKKLSKLNEPANVKFVYLKACSILNKPLEEIIEKVWRNANLFIKDIK